MKRTGLIFALLLALAGTAILAFHLGTEAGQADYQDRYIRELQFAAHELARETQKSDYGKSRLFAVRLAALTRVVGMEETFALTLADESDSVIEFNDTNGFLPIEDTYLQRLQIDLLTDGAMMFNDVEINADQLRAIAELVIEIDNRSRLFLRASRDVSVVHIKTAVKAAGEAGMTDVIFAAFDPADSP